MEEAKKRRSTARRLFTFAVKSAESLVKSRSVPTVDQLTKAYDKLEDMYDALVTTNEEVLSKLPDDVSDTDLNDAVNYLQEIEVHRTELTACIQNIMSDVQRKQRIDSQVPSDTSTKPVAVKSQLERLKIQTFAGNIREYPGWKNSFLSTMTKYSQDKEEQLQRLKDAVLSPARKDIIHCLTVDSAIAILDQNYGNADELMSILLKDIKSYKPVKSGSSHSLKLFASELRCFIVRMTDLGKTNDLKSDYIIADLLEKLPPEDQYKYKSLCFDKKVPKTLETLVSWLGDEAQLRANLVLDDYRKVRTGSSNSVSFKPQAQSNRPCILKCHNSHSLKYCPVFKDMKVSDRWNVIKSNKCCFCCLKPFHQTKSCCEKKQCDKPNCDKTHNNLLHEDLNQTFVKPSTNTCVVGCGNLPGVRINVFDDYSVPHVATALLDSGSQKSLIRKSFVNKLRLVGNHPQNIHISLAAGHEMYEKSQNFDLKVAAINKDEIYNMHANSLETVCGDLTPIDKQELFNYPHLSGLVTNIYCEGGPVDLLIGTDFPFAFKELGQCSLSNINAPIAKQTPLGWILLGELSNCQDTNYVNHIMILDEPNVAKFFEVESLGVKPTEQCTCKESELLESAFIDSLKSNTAILPDGRIQMKMPWKKGHPNFPDSRNMALKRLISLENRLIQTNKTSVYDFEIRKLLSDGFCLKLQSEDIDWNKPFWLLPHQN